MANTKNDRSNPMMTPAERAGYAGIVLLYLFIGGLFAIRTPPWQAPDEPAHYNYVAQVATGTILPQIQPGDWDNARLETLKRKRFSPEVLSKLDTIRYENHQPPLYYWLLTPVFALSAGNLILLRFFSLLIGLIVILMAYRITLEIYPNSRKTALATMALVAFLPQHLAILASMNNDALALAVLAVLLWTTIRYLKHEKNVHSWQLGILIGIAILSKTTVYFMGAVVMLAILLRWYDTPKNRTFSGLFTEVVSFFVGMLPFALFWFGRNIAVYDFPDFLGLRAHDAVVVGQLRTADYIADIGQGAYLQTALLTTYNSFRGQFGWMAVPLDNWMYTLLDVMVLFALGGRLLFAFHPGMRPSQNTNPVRRQIAIVITVMVSLIVLMFIYYNTAFVQFQGRYLFGLWIPLAITLASGLMAWRNLLFARWRMSEWLPVAVCMGLCLLDMYLIWRVIPGALAPA